ncbi:hypothetical protein INR49_010656 [Caranx melampygus]|nr:hypothetical protein INR49_010656 [Caranx melampygus]
MAGGERPCRGGRRHGGGMETHLRESLGCWDRGYSGDQEMVEGPQEATVPWRRFGGWRERGLLLRSLPSVMHLPSGWQQAWSGVRWSEHGLSGAPVQTDACEEIPHYVIVKATYWRQTLPVFSSASALPENFHNTSFAGERPLLAVMQHPTPKKP